MSRLLGFLTAVAHPGELWEGGGGDEERHHPHGEEVDEDEIDAEDEEEEGHARQGGGPQAPGAAGGPAGASAPAPAPHPVCRLVGLLCELLLPESNCGVATRVAALQGGWRLRARTRMGRWATTSTVLTYLCEDVVSRRPAAQVATRFAALQGGWRWWWYR